MWVGEHVAILASGPSMSQSIADEVMRSAVRTIAINTTYELAPWADMLYAADGQWWERHAKKAKSFPGMKVTIAPNFQPDLLCLQNGGQHGFEDDPGKIKVGGNSGYQAICIAVLAGAKKISLYGFDMRSVKNVHHWHGVHPSPLRNHGESMYEKWLKAFSTLAPELKKRGVEVVNCTPGSALKCFPFQEPQRMAA
jgi:hypothetical protein